MNLEAIHQFLLYSLAINYGILIVWFLAFVFARDWIRALHGRWFALTDSTYDAIHYGAMAVYKLGIMLFNLTPLIAVYLLRNSGS